MLTKKRVTLPKLISYILSFTEEEDIDHHSNDTVFSNQIKSNDEFKFNLLKVGEQKNINDFPEKLKTIFDPFIKEFIRYGCRDKFDDMTDHFQNSHSKTDVNLSLYYCLLTMLINDYSSLPIKDQISYIHKLRDRLIIHVSQKELFSFQAYDKLNWNKKDIINGLVQFKTNKILIKLLADYFNLNIFILNITEDKIYVISENDSFDVFRPSVFLSYYNDTFEPLIYSDTNLLNYSHPVIKKLITIDKNFLILINCDLNKNEELNFNIKLSNILMYVKDDLEDNNVSILKEEIQKEESHKDNSDTVDNDFEEIIPLESDTNAYIKDIELDNKNKQIKNKLVFKISPKMKLEELQTIASKLNIDLQKDGNKKKIAKTKNELITEINVILGNN